MRKCVKRESNYQFAHIHSLMGSCCFVSIINTKLLLIKFKLTETFHLCVRLMQFFFPHQSLTAYHDTCYQIIINIQSKNCWTNHGWISWMVLLISCLVMGLTSPVKCKSSSNWFSNSFSMPHSLALTMILALTWSTVSPQCVGGKHWPIVAWQGKIGLQASDEPSIELINSIGDGNLCWGNPWRINSPDDNAVIR